MNYLTHSRDSKTPSNLAHQGTQRQDSRRLDVGSDIAVDDESADQIQNSVDNLKHGKRLVEGPGILGLGHETEVCNVGD